VTKTQAVIQLQLPGNLREIPLESVIRHRNRPGFKERQKAFHEELETFIGKAESGVDPSEVAKSIGSAWSDFSDDVVNVGAGAVAFGLGIWLPFGSGVADIPNTLKEIAGGASLAVGSCISVRKPWQNSSPKRCTRKYLADLKRLKPISFEST
jgi:hypothetical protein